MALSRHHTRLSVGEIPIDESRYHILPIRLKSSYVYLSKHDVAHKKEVSTNQDLHRQVINGIARIPLADRAEIFSLLGL